MFNVHLSIIQTTPLHGGRLRAANDAASFRQPKGVWLPGGDERTIFIHVEGKEENIEGSWRNHMEVTTATGLFLRIATENGWLNHKDLSTGRIAMTTAYTAQCHELNEKLCEIGCGSFKVESVAKMQGFECDVMILSCVRSNSKGVVGFLEDHRRLNVMLARARLLTLIVGNAWTLCNARDSKGLWYELLQELSTRDCVVNENFETIVMLRHEKETPRDDTWKLRRSSKKKEEKTTHLRSRHEALRKNSGHGF